MSNRYEIWVIVILILAIVGAHSVPVIINNTNTERFRDRLWVHTDPPKTMTISLHNKIDRKYNNIVVNLNLDGYEFKPSSTNVRCGTNCAVTESKEFSKYIAESLGLTNNHLIYLVRANTGHRIKMGRMESVNNFDGNLKEITSIWYLFGPLELNFRDGWIFHTAKDKGYYMPEKNSIIEFYKDDRYEMLPLTCAEPKYFVIILNF